MTIEQPTAAYQAQVRAKYTQAEVDALGAKGEALKDPTGGHYSYPIADEEDLKKAIHAVGRGNADHDTIRAYIIRRAKALGCSSLIPENWNSDGSLSDQANQATPDSETRDDPIAGPTASDPGIAAGLQAAKSALAQLKGAQLADPDNGTDPVDAQVLACISAAEAQIDQAIVAQTKDGAPTPTSTDDLTNPDKAAAAKPKEAKSMVPATVKRAFWSLIERPVPVSAIEVRMDAEGADPNVANFVGYASTTGTGYAVADWLGEYRETIVPGAFGKTLREQKDVPLLFNHDGIPLASTGSATSRLSEDGQGLRNEATFDRSDGNTNTICVQLKRGVLNKMSFSFRAVRDTWNDSYDERNVDELALFDTSIVTYPANPSTTAELRSEFREALGREGLAVMYSTRAALAGYVETRSLEEEAEPVLEAAMRALAAADEVMCRRSAGPYVRSRTFLVAGLMEEVRAGKTLSAKNQKLLQTAADALASGAKQHAKAVANHNKAAGALAQVLPDGTGANNGAPAGDNPINPTDGAGPRSAVPASVALAKRQLAELRTRARRSA